MSDCAAAIKIARNCATDWNRSMQDPVAGAIFEPEQVSRLHRAFEIGLKMLNSTGQIDDAISRKLTSALIRYIRLDDRREPEEIARLAVRHVLVMSAPLEF